uniref:ZAD domain-containing protein n=1 Tax=Branchiostoma floridae TaxID=7739 RepID=C3ZLP2_BRAFL|eukprot:XP_002590504.1 hypothetical protein BRAFLDRAFT_86175 [Branchiostoma floridae]
MEDVPFTSKLYPCTPERSTTEPCVPERSTTESCVPERCKTEPCVPERSTTGSCVPERCTTEPCVPERSTIESCEPERSTTLYMYSVFGMAKQSQTKQGNKSELPQIKEHTLTQQLQRKEPTLTKQLETMEVSLTQQSQTKGAYTTEQPQTNERTVTQCQTMEVILTPQPQTNHAEMQTVMPNIASKKTCLFCQKVITCRNYRSIFSKAVVEVHPQIQQILNLWPDKEVWTRKGLSNIVCQPCFGKLKKLVKIDEELSTILQRLQEEKQSLIRTLQSNAKIPTSLEDTPVHTTPTEPKSGGVKRKGREKTEIPPKVIKRHLAKYVPIAPAGIPSELEKRHLAKYVLIAPAPAPGPDKNLAPTTRLTSDSFIPLKNEQDNLIQDSTGSLMDTVDTAKVIATDPSVQKWVVQDAGDSQYLKALNGDTSTEPGAASQNLMNIKCKEEPL